MGKVEKRILLGSGYETWMRRRQFEFHDSVDPVHVQEIDGCHVVWARREGISQNGPFNFYHIGCDHLGPVPKDESEIQAMLGCSAVQKYLLSSAEIAANETFQLDRILPPFLVVEDDGLYLDGEGEIIASNFVFEALAKTIGEPERCQGNIKTGLHVKPVLSFMLGGVAESQVEEILAGLEFQGIIKQDDPFVEILEVAA
jgi:hypothetical protein